MVCVASQARLTLYQIQTFLPSRPPQAASSSFVHIHDEKVYAEAQFDHSLYCQGEPVINRIPAGSQELAPWRMQSQDRQGKLFPPVSDHVSWEESIKVAGGFLDTYKTAGIIDGKQPCYRQFIKGIWKNEDVRVKIKND